jgi:hypothetical protein
MLVKSKEQMDRGSFRMLDRDISADTCSDILNKNLRLFFFINKNGSSALAVYTKHFTIFTKFKITYLQHIQ